MQNLPNFRSKIQTGFIKAYCWLKKFKRSAFSHFQGNLCAQNPSLYEIYPLEPLAFGPKSNFGWWLKWFATWHKWFKAPLKIKKLSNLIVNSSRNCSFIPNPIFQAIRPIRPANNILLLRKSNEKIDNWNSGKLKLDKL